MISEEGTPLNVRPKEEGSLEYGLVVRGIVYNRDDIEEIKEAARRSVGVFLQSSSRSTGGMVVWGPTSSARSLCLAGSATFLLTIRRNDYSFIDFCALQCRLTRRGYKC